MGAARVITTRVMFTIGPGRLEVAAGTGALLIHGAACTLPHVAEQGDAARWFSLGAAHGDPMRGNQHHLIVRHQPADRLALTPVERHTKMRTAGAARKARISVRHDLEDSETGKGRHLAAYSMQRQALVKGCLMAG